MKKNRRYIEEKEELAQIIDMMKRDINKRGEKEVKYKEQKYKRAVLYDYGLIDEIEIL